MDPGGKFKTVTILHAAKTICKYYCNLTDMKLEYEGK